MARGLNCKVAIIGGGPAGCMCAYYLQNDFDVTIFEAAVPLKTLLATGGGRCNLAHNEYDFKELAANYPRGEKFLYSVFSRFSTADTLEFFRSIGVETYVQEDMRIFPVSNSAADVRSKFLQAIKEVNFKTERVLRINRGDNFTVVSDNGSGDFDIRRGYKNQNRERFAVLSGQSRRRRKSAGWVYKSNNHGLWR